MSTPSEDRLILVESTVSHRTGAPLVTFRWGAMVGQVSTAEARAHALLILSAADAAESDAFIVQFITDKLKTTKPEIIAGVLAEFRAYRGQLEDKQ